MEKNELKQNPFTLKFGKLMEDRYRLKVFPIALRSFKMVFYFLLALDVYIIIVDLFRLQNPLYSVATRLLMLGFYIVVIIGSNYLNKVGPKYHQTFVFSCLLAMYLMVVIQDANGDMYYLFFSNVAFTLIYIVFTVSGLRFYNAVILSVIYLAVYLAYCFWLYPNQFHADQLPNLLINWVIAAMAGYILEKSSRSAFVNDYLLERKNYEMALVNDELEEYNGLKDRLLSVVSHDVQSPLTSINTFLQLLKNESLTASESAELVKNLESRVSGTIGYIQKILFWTKNQMNGFNVKKESILLSDYLDQRIQSFDWQAQPKGIKLESMVGKEATIVSDQEMLDIVLRNIISNGIKFSHENGKIEISFNAGADHDTLAIRDFGVGISEERLKGLFELNHNHTVGTKLERGSGLGLSLCAEFMKKLNGSLEVESQLGEGSCFYLKFAKSGQSTA